MNDNKVDKEHSLSKKKTWSSLIWLLITWELKYESSIDFLQVDWRPMIALTLASSSIGFAYLSSAGGNNDPCLLEEACEFGQELK